MNLTDIDPDSLFNIFVHCGYYNSISLAKTCRKLYTIFKQNENRLVHNHIITEYHVNFKYDSTIKYKPLFEIIIDRDIMLLAMLLDDPKLYQQIYDQDKQKYKTFCMYSINVENKFPKVVRYMMDEIFFSRDVLNNIIIPYCYADILEEMLMEDNTIIESEPIDSMLFNVYYMKITIDEANDVLQVINKYNAFDTIESFVSSSYVYEHQYIIKEYEPSKFRIELPYDKILFIKSLKNKNLDVFKQEFDNIVSNGEFKMGGYFRYFDRYDYDYNDYDDYFRYIIERFKGNIDAGNENLYTFIIKGYITGLKMLNEIYPDIHNHNLAMYSCVRFELMDDEKLSNDQKYDTLTYCTDNDLLRIDEDIDDFLENMKIDDDLMKRLREFYR